MVVPKLPTLKLQSNYAKALVTRFIGKELRVQMKYDISTGKLTLAGKEYQGYSGHGQGLNNPAMQGAKGVGPLPVGLWRLTTWVDHPHLGKLVTHLLPIRVPQDYGRSGFFIHGDNPKRNHTASDGCLIFDLDIRRLIKASGDTTLEVVE